MIEQEWSHLQLGEDKREGKQKQEEKSMKRLKMPWKNQNPIPQLQGTS